MKPEERYQAIETMCETIAILMSIDERELAYQLRVAVDKLRTEWKR